MDSKNNHIDIDDIFNTTDTEDDHSSSSSSNPAIFKITQPFVLELHDIKKDEPNPETPNPETPNPEVKVKKTKKKKRAATPAANKSHTSASSSTPSETSTARVEETPKEEFYDAHESYHALPENQTSAAMAAAALVQAAAAESVHGPESKVAPQRAQSTEPVSARARKPSSTVSKPPPVP